MQALSIRTPIKHAGDVCRRLYFRLKARYLRWQLRSMRETRARWGAELTTLVDAAIVMALANQHSPTLTQRRRALRIAIDEITREIGLVAEELQQLEKRP